jgi:hypothetical protein
MLLFERGHHRHHRLDKPRPLGTLGAKAAFAPQDTRADGAVTVDGGIAPSTSASKPCMPLLRHTAPQ